MAEVSHITKDYFGLTLYISPRGRPEKVYACRAVTWKPTRGGGLNVVVQCWPGYGHYRGQVRLNRKQRAEFFKTMEIQV